VPGTRKLQEGGGDLGWSPPPVSPQRQIPMLAAAFLAGAVGVWALTKDDESPPQDAQPAPERVTEPIPPEPPPGGGETPEQEKPTAANEEASRVERAVRDYVAAISDRDGEVLCELVDGIADLDLPADHGGCAESVSDSIGYRDPRGYPVFEKAVLAGAPEVKIDDRDARATATVVTEFADRREASVEDDLVYLVRRGGEWAIAKPSSTLYRAIGSPDVPPGVLQPAGG
jgi:hypothetical protein